MTVTMKQSNIYRDILDESSEDQGENASRPDTEFDIVTSSMIDQYRSLQNTYEEWKKLIKDENMDENKDRLRAAEG